MGVFNMDYETYEESEKFNAEKRLIKGLKKAALRFKEDKNLDRLELSLLYFLEDIENERILRAKYN